MDINYKELLEIAKCACENSYSPYSKFPVGACVLFDNMNRYSGANVENTSFGLTLCAERAAIANAISAGEKGRIVAIAIYARQKDFCTPCGACRQWMSEFAKDGDMKIVLEDKNYEPKIFTLSELLPHNFRL